MKPRIFINIHYLEIGGAESALTGLLQALDPARADVDLFLNDPRGELVACIPPWVNVLPACRAYTMIERPLTAVVAAGFVRIAAARLWAKMMYRLYALRRRPSDGSAIFGYVGRYVTPQLPSLEHLGEYDLAISFLAPHNIVLDKVRARRKACWIHTDYSRIDVNTALELPVWSGYDRIVSISDDVTRTFCRRFPSLRDRIVRIENILSPEFVRRLAAGAPPSDMPRDGRGCTLLTIGRYSPAKRLDAIPALCRRLVDRGIDARWYIIGYGGSDDYIRRATVAEGMTERVVLLGKRTNPYPYIAACDWYVQPSLYEGKSVVVREAQILCKPVIVTAYPTSASQVRNGVDGVIVPLPEDECADAMAEVLADERLKTGIAARLAAGDYGCRSEVEKVYALAADDAYAEAGADMRTAPIPKTIHYCWFGGKPLPASARRCIESWRRHLPGCEIREWNESNFDVNAIPYTRDAYARKKYAFVSDYARFSILCRHGGIYFDTDVELIRPLDDIIARGAFMGIEDAAGQAGVNPGLGMGAPAGMGLFAEILDRYADLRFADDRGVQLPGTVVKHTTEVLARHGFDGANRLQQVAGVWIYPNDWFNPLDDATGRISVTANTRSIHRYAKTWVDNYGPARIWITRRLHRLFGVARLQRLRKYIRI